MSTETCRVVIPGTKESITIAIEALSGHAHKAANRAMLTLRPGYTFVASQLVRLGVHRMEYINQEQTLGCLVYVYVE